MQLVCNVAERRHAVKPLAKAMFLALASKMPLVKHMPYMELTPEARIRPSPQAAIHDQLKRLLLSRPFERCERLRGLLDFLVDAHLRGISLSEAQIAQSVIGKGNDFDSLVDPVVRVYVGRLRKRLEEYYASEGQHDLIRFSIVPGSYRVSIQHGTNDADRGFRRPVPGVFQVAVLPCANLTGNADAELTCRCLNEELLISVSQMYGVEAYCRGFGTTPFSAFDAIIDSSLRRDTELIRISIRVLHGGGRVAASFSEDYPLDAGLDHQEAIAARVVGMVEELRSEIGSTGARPASIA